MDMYNGSKGMDRRAAMSKYTTKATWLGNEYGCRVFIDGQLVVEEVISTRRLVHIVKAFSILGDKQGAINACLARFDAETKASFLDLFEKVTAPPEPAVVDEIDRAAAESYEVPASI